MQIKSLTRCRDFLQYYGFHPGVGILVMLIMTVVFLEAQVRAQSSSCWVCSKKPIEYTLHLDPNTSVVLTAGNQNITLNASGLPKDYKDVVKIDPYSEAQSIETNQAGKVARLELKLQLSGFPQDQTRTITANVSACGVEIPAPGYLQVSHVPPTNTGGNTCACTDLTTYKRGYYWVGTGGWMDEREGHVGGFASLEEAEAALTAFTEGYNNDQQRFNGSTYSDNDGFGYNGTYQSKGVDRTQPSQLFDEDQPRPAGAVFDRPDTTSASTTTHTVNPWCPIHGVPDTNTGATEPTDKLLDSMTIKIDMPGTGTGGEKGGTGDGTIGDSGMPIQPSSPPGGDEGPQTLPLFWTWDLGTSTAGNAIGTLTLRSDLTAANPLGLDKFVTREATPGSMTVTTITGLAAGQTGRRIAPAVVNTAAIQTQIDTLTAFVLPFQVALANLNAAYEDMLIGTEDYQSQSTTLQEAIAPYEAAIAPLQRAINNATLDAANAIRLDVVKLSATVVEVRRFKGGGNTPGIVHQFELIAVNGMPSVKHTVNMGNTTKVEIDGGTMANGGRTWSLQDFDGIVHVGTEVPWTGGLQVVDESVYRQVGELFQQRTVTTRANKPWGVEIIEQRFYNSDAPNAVPEISTSTFYENAADTASFGKLKWRVERDGSWTSYEYLSTGETRVMRPWKNSPGSPQMASPSNSRCTLTSADGQTVIESITGVVVSTTMTQTHTGVSYPSPDGAGVAGSNTGDTFTRTDHIRRHGTNGTTLISQDYVNERTGRTDWSKDESGLITTWTESLVYVSPGSYQTAIRRVQQQLPQAVEAGVPASAPPPAVAEYLDYQDQVLRREILAPDGTPASTTQYAYDTATGQQTEVIQDGVTVWTAGSNSLDAAGNQVELAMDAQGITTRTTTTPDGTVSRSKLAVDGTVLVTSITSTNGLTETTTTTGGGLTQQSSVTKDSEGRVLQQVDDNGVVTNYEYQDGGRMVIEKDVANTVRQTRQQFFDGQLLSLTGAAVVPEYHDYAVGSDGLITETTHYGTADGAMYRKQVTNGLGQLLQVISPPQDGGTMEKITQYTYDNNGRVSLTQTTGSAPVKTLYDGLSRATVHRMLLGADGTETADDPLTTCTWTYATTDSGLWAVTTTRQAVDANPDHDLISVSKQQIGGSSQVQISQSSDGAILTQTTTLVRATATVTTTLTSSRATNTATRITINGLLQAETSFNATTATTYSYDDLERQLTKTTPDGVVHKTIYDDTPGGSARSRVLKDQLVPAGGDTAITQATYTYDSRSRVESVTRADNSAKTSYTYDDADRVLTQTGSGTYPLRYEYDLLGRLWKLHTYRDASHDDVTIWDYDEASGNLLSKTDAATHKVSYLYDMAGRVHTRTWQRGVTATYSYDGAGRQTGIDYSESTPDVSNITYDRAGRRVGITDAAGVHAFTYDATNGGQLATWSVAGNGTWSGLSVGYGCTSGQRTSRDTSLGTLTLPSVGYTYDPVSGRMATVTASDFTATYRYNASTGWNEGVTYTGGVSSTRTPDDLGRLDTISWSNGSSTISGHDYTINAMNRRTDALRQDGSAWSYGYNDRGEVTSATKGTEPGKQFSFEYDGIGNRTSSKVSSVADSNVVRTTGYTPNALNQYASIIHPQPGWLVLRGSANTAAGATVTIDGNAPTLSVGTLWYHEQSVDNSTCPVRQTVTIAATRPDGGRNNGPVTTQQKGALFVPPPSEVPTYDEDGNQTSDARWSYTWDGENRLIAAEEKTGFIVQPMSSAAVKRTRLEFDYDAQGRRIGKRTFIAAGSGGFVLQQSMVCLYDGWNMIAEIDTTSSAQLLRSYEWGMDISGTMAGAGGVGGLLIERFHTLPSSGTHVPCYDGNGNVTELVKLANGSVSARYDYGAFGETISMDGGTVAEANPFRFSTRYLDVETGLYNYGYRLYDAPNARWLNRDPIGERGGINLYATLHNDLVNAWDYLGLQEPENPQQPAQVQVTPLTFLKAYKLTFKGEDIGTAMIDNYPPGQGVRLGMSKDPATNMVVPTGKYGIQVAIKITKQRASGGQLCMVRWRQRVTLEDDKGNKLKMFGVVVNNSLDPVDPNYPGRDNKEWYWSDAERNKYQSLSGGVLGEVFFDEATVRYQDQAQSMKWTAKLELVRVDDIKQAGGGDVLTTITWGFTMTKQAQGVPKIAPDPTTANPPLQPR